MATYPIKMLKDKDGTLFVPLTNTESIRTSTGQDLEDMIDDKQDALVSGTNIKTINNQSLLGSGNINIEAGSQITVDDALSGTSTNPVQNKVIKSALDNKANTSAVPTKTSDLTNDSGFTTNVGTITSVKMNGTVVSDNGQADLGTVLTSYTETDPVFSASAAKNITATDISNWNNKQSALSTQTAYSAKGNATKVPQITTNSLGQVTKIDEVTITQPTKTSDLTNDSNFVNTTQLATKQDVLIAGDNIDITDNTIKTKTRGIEYIVGTQTAATNAWTGTTTDTDCENSTLYVGKTIVYHLPYAGTSDAATLNLTLPDGTTTGAKTIYRVNNTTVTTTYAAGNDIFMVWNGSNWKCSAYVDSNTNTIGYQLRTNSAIYANKTGYSMNRYMLFFEVDGGLSGAATTIGTGTSKTTVAFKYIPGGVIKYNTTNAAVANNANFTATGLWNQYVVDLRYTFNTGTTLTSGKPVYMRCVVNSDGTLTPNYAGSPSHPIVQVLPTSADGYVYVYLGQAYSTTNIELIPNHPIYEYKNGRIREWQYDTSITSSDVTNALGYTPYNSTNPNGYTSNTGTITGITMNGSSKGTSGVVDLGTVITSHQDISGKQDTLVSGTNIKTINNTSLLGSGNINISTGGTATDVEINGISITSDNTANIAVDGTYNASTNKIATMSSLPTSTSDLTNDSGFITGITSSDVTNALGYTPYNSTNPNGYTSNTGTITGVSVNGDSVATSGVANIQVMSNSEIDAITGYVAS